MAEPLVQFHNVSKYYRAFPALRNVTFQLNQGEVFGYIGPNGAGKTTTLKLLVGLFSSFEGEVRIGDLVLPKDHLKIHQVVGYLPQYPEFQTWRTVDQALMTLGRLSEVHDDLLKKRIPELLERFELGHVQHKKIKQLSGGMKQKVGFVQALLHDPKLLVLDEPLSGLDPQSRIALKKQILQLKSEGTTVIFSSHILGDVQDVADRMGFIQNGEMLKAGTLAELKDFFGFRREVHIEYSTAPNSFAFLNQLQNVSNIQQPKKEKVVLEIEAGAAIESVIHESILGSIAADGRILKIGEVNPSLDDLYSRFISTSQNQNPAQ